MKNRDRNCRLNILPEQSIFEKSKPEQVINYACIRNKVYQNGKLFQIIGFSINRLSIT